MTAQIYLLGDDAKLLSMSEAPYDSESLLQELLAKYPNLLAGEQMDLEKPRRWVLVSREFGVPGEEDGANRWSLDHLFIDQDGVPTLVEVKRSTDTRIRREVVGQLLDYAANAVSYWSVEEIRSRFEAQCEADGTSAEDRLAEFLDPEAEIDSFWERVKTNLQAGRIRMVFVADIHPQIIRILSEPHCTAKPIAWRRFGWRSTTGPSSGSMERSWLRWIIPVVSTSLRFLCHSRKVTTSW